MTSVSTMRRAFITEIIYVNLAPKGGYTDLARNVSDPSDWVLVTDYSEYDMQADVYRYTTHPGSGPIWGLGKLVRGRNGFGALRGINTGTVNAARRDHVGVSR